MRFGDDSGLTAGRWTIVDARGHSWAPPRTFAEARGHKNSAAIRKRPRADNCGKGADCFGSARTFRGSARTKPEIAANARGLY